MPYPCWATPFRPMGNDLHPNTCPERSAEKPQALKHQHSKGPARLYDDISHKVFSIPYRTQCLIRGLLGGTNIHILMSILALQFHCSSYRTPIQVLRIQSSCFPLSPSSDLAQSSAETVAKSANPAPLPPSGADIVANVPSALIPTAHANSVPACH